MQLRSPEDGSESSEPKIDMTENGILVNKVVRLMLGRGQVAFIKV
jgi:hypothetical protein